MPRDSRMSRLLHVLIHMDRHAPRLTSDQIAKMLDTNPVVVRRMMAGPKRAGLVAAERGPSGGWHLARPLAQITLLDIYTALGTPPVFNIGPGGGPGGGPSECYVEQAVDTRMQAALAQAETLLRQQFSAITLEDIGQDFDAMLARRDGTEDGAQDGCAHGGDDCAPGSRA